MYKSIIRPLFFSFDPEKIHEASFSLMRFAHKAGLLRLVGAKDAGEFPRLKQNLFGIDFPNPVGLAAGFDKNAQLFTELSSLGFGFIEIGTVTPKPQEGNPKKRLFRLKEDEGIINRMGFNNEGVAAAVERLKKNPKVGEKGHVIIGGNIGKNKTTPNEEAVKDYLICFHALFEYVDYFVVNVSSPNTPDLRALQEKEPLTSLLKALQDENAKKQSKKPILLKIAPDLNNDQLLDIIEIVEKSKIDGVIATNTTLSRDGLSSKNKTESGGLSGRPLTERATEVIRFLSEKSNKAFPIIGVGGIHSPEDAIEKIKAGASLIQLYTGFIYEGPQLIEKINRALIETHL